MTSLLSGRHRYLTNKNTKKGQKVRKKLSVRERSHFLPLKTGTALSPQAKAVQHPAGSRFFEMIYFFCTLYPQTSWLRKNEQTREKPPKSWDFGGSMPWYLFWLHNMYRAAEKDIAFKSGRHYRIPAIFRFATQPAPTLSMTSIILTLYFFNLRLIQCIPTMPFQKTILCYNSIGSRRRLTILVLAEVHLWKWLSAQI